MAKLEDVQADLKGQLGGGAAPAQRQNQYAPGGRPQVVNGLVVPAASAQRGAGPIYVPVGNVRSVRTTRRGIGAFTPGGWVLLWEGDDTEERDAALVALLDDLGEFSRRRR